MKASEWYHVEQLSDELYGIGEPKHIEEVNSFLLVSDEGSILIDTGMGLLSMKSVIAPITNKHCLVLNTHSHFDHIGSNHEFSVVKLYDHPANRSSSINGRSREYLLKRCTPDQFTEQPPLEVTKSYSIKPFPNATFFSNGDIVGNSSFQLEVIHTPGHSDDSVCFWNKDRGWLFAGDLLYDGPIFIEKSGGLTKFKNSLLKISKLKGLKNIYSSHNYFQFSLEKLQLLLDTLDKIESTELEKTIVIEDRLKLVPD